MIGAMTTDPEDAREAAELALLEKYGRPGSWTTFLWLVLLIALPAGAIMSAITGVH